MSATITTPVEERSENAVPSDRQVGAHVAAAMISARLDRLPVSRTGIRIVILLSLGFFFELYGLLATGYLAPGLMRAGIFTMTTPGLFGTSGIASFMASLFFGLFCGTLACGFLADRYGRRTVFVYSLLWFMLTNMGMLFMNSAFAINCWRFLTGVGIGVEMVTIGTFLSEIAPMRLRGRSFALCQTFGFSAVPIVAIISYLLVPNDPLGIDGWRWVVLIGALGGVYAWWIRRDLPESPRWLALHGRILEADAIMCEIEAKIEAETGRPLPAPADVGDIRLPEKVRFANLWVPPYRNRMIMMIMFNIFQTIGYFGFANWVPSLLISQGIGVTKSLLYTTIIALANPIGPMIGLLIGDRFERKHVIVAVAALNVVCGLLFSQATDPLTISILGVALTLAGTVISYTYHTYQSEIFPTAIRARAVGFVYSWSRFSAIFNAFLIAFFLRNFGVTGVFIFIGAAMIVVMLVIGLMGPRTRNVSIEKISN
ncbi:MAG TPA: MFS transporter [Telmatospirillum sp.]|nr:MFS transporter [Telmatospirillum sp.]